MCVYVLFTFVCVPDLVLVWIVCCLFGCCCCVVFFVAFTLGLIVVRLILGVVWFDGRWYSCGVIGFVA